MTATIDPTMAKFYPEVLPEAITVTASLTGTPIASYGLFEPNIIVFNSLFTDVGENVKFRLDKDSLYGVLDVEGTARSDREETKVEVPCEDSLNLWATGAATEIAYTAYTIKCGIPTIFEKIKYGMYLSQEEQEIDNKYEISKRFSAGLLSKADSPIFEKEVEIAELVTVAVGGNTTVGPIINVPSGKKAVILSFGTNSAFGGLIANDTFISLTRGISETEYVKLDTMAMPGLNHDINCYIPAINRLEVLLESASGVTNMPVRYKYAISDISIIEKIRWGKFGPGLTSEESAIATELDLFNVAFTGIM